MATAETESTLVYKDIHGDYQRRDNSDSPPTPTSSDGSLYSAVDISVRSTSSSAAFETCSSHQSSSADTSKAATLPNVDGADAAVLRDFDESAKNRASNSSEASDRSTGSSLVKGSNKPHKANDARWKAISTVQLQDNEKLGLNHFKLLKRLGCGDIGSVYLSQLNCSKCLFAMKVMDKRSLASRKKLHRAQIEREILTSLDHPFLPTLYTHFETDKYYCLVMEFCPGGDLHNLRQRQRGKCFTEQAVRFYASEVLLALEYLHMLGIVYRDLKPENILVREDGHIMLSDFDLSLRCAVSPTLVKPESAQMDSLLRKVPAYCIEPGCVEIKPSCLPPHSILSKYRKTRKPKTDTGCNAASLPELVAEPTGAKSMSFVGTHEYLAPEIIRGKGHGSAVDWWTFGIFLYELLFGKTPFKGEGNRETLLNVIRHPLRFPDFPIPSFGARDLIRGLLVKEPQHRLASRRGAAELKQHPFFDGVNWALIRCTSPPGIPSSFELDSDKASSSSEQKVSKHSNSTEHYLEFELF